MISVVYSFLASSDLTCHLAQILELVHSGCTVPLDSKEPKLMAGTSPSNKEGPGKMQKSCKRGDPEHFGFFMLA